MHGKTFCTVALKCPEGGDLTLFETLTSGAFDHLKRPRSREFDVIIHSDI